MAASLYGAVIQMASNIGIPVPELGLTILVLSILIFLVVDFRIGLIMGLIMSGILVLLLSFAGLGTGNVLTFMLLIVVAMALSFYMLKAAKESGQPIA